MEQLNSLQQQAKALRLAFDVCLDQGQTLEKSREIYQQLKAMERMIYERKILLIREGLYRR